MWAQLITMRVKEGSDGGDESVRQLLTHLTSIEQADSGWLRTTALRDQADPRTVLVLAVFENEEKARARESDPRRAEGLGKLRELLSGILDAPPQFTDLAVVDEVHQAQ